MNGQDANKNPRDLKRLAVTQTLMETHQLELLWKENS